MNREPLSRGFSTKHLDRITELFTDSVSRSVLPGVVWLLWRRDGIAHVVIVGWQDKDEKIPMQRNSLFRIASMTKPITAVATFMLIEQGTLNLQSSIDNWLPELANLKVLRGPTVALDDVVPADKPISVQDLLSHRSGIGYGFNCSGPISEALTELGDEMDTGVKSDEWLRHLAEVPLMFQPGSRWEYGLSTDVLGILIERASGMSFSEFLHSRIFAPLGMEDTSFSVPHDKLDRLTVAYQQDNDNVHKVLEHPGNSKWAKSGIMASGGGGLVSTADDYLCFARMLLGRGQLNGVRVISPDSLDMMTANHMSVEDRTLDVFGTPFFAGQHYGLGVAVTDDPEKRQQTIGYASTGSYSWGGIYGTSWLADPVEQMIHVLMIQLQASESSIKLGSELMKLLYDAIVD